MIYRQLKAQYAGGCLCHEPEIGAWPPMPDTGRFPFTQLAREFAAELGVENLQVSGKHRVATGMIASDCPHGPRPVRIYVDYV